MDILEYNNWGFFGCSENKSTPTKDINWADAYSTCRAVRDAFDRCATELIQSSRSIFLRYERYTDFIYTVGIDTTGKEKFVQAVNYYNEKFIEFDKNIWIFWNTFQTGEDKLTGEFTYNKEIINLTVENFDQLSEPTQVEYTIDFSLYQILNEDIYKNYINSFADYLFSCKVLFKVLTDSNFEKGDIRDK